MTTALERYRESNRLRTPIHPLERTLVAITCVHLAFLPWALGTMHAWSQLTSLGLSLAAMAVALVPRHYSGDYLPPGLRPSTASPQPEHAGLAPPDGGSRHGVAQVVRLATWPRLVRFPAFWIGLALLGYLALQSSNPSWTWERNSTHWWLRRVTDITWLPTSVHTPFERFNLWRQFIIYAAAWLTVCSLWTGLTRRRSLELILIFVVVNGCAVAAAGSAQRVIGRDFLLAAMGAHSTGYSFGTFIYHNHAGAWLALHMAVAAALASWFHHRGERAFRKSTPAGLCAVAALFLAGAVFFTLSRGATLTVVAFGLGFGGWLFVRRQLSPAAGANPAVTAAVVVLFLAVLGYTARQLDFSALFGKFDRLITQQSREESTRARLLAHASAREMLADHGLRGVGAGGFRYLFPEYIKDKPEIYAGGVFFWEHAHNDWLQVPIELGLAGSLLLAAGALAWLRTFFRRPRAPPGAALNAATGGSPLGPSPSSRSPGFIATEPGHAAPLLHSLAVPIALGCAQTLVHAWFDFPFQNPAILVTWLALLTIALRWMELERN